MSKSSAQAEVQFYRQSCTYTVVLMSMSGDLWQEYTQEGTNVTITPDWSVTANQPTIEFVCVSSRVSTGEVSVSSSNIKWYFNDTEISFGSNNISTGTYAGIFKKVTTSNGRQGLTITNNIAAAAGYASCVIKAAATVIDGSVSDTITATYSIPIQQSSGNSYKVTIAAGDSYNCVLGNDNNSVKLKAMTYFEGAAATATLTYQWYEWNGSDWKAISGATSQTLTVYKNSTDGTPYVDTYKEFKVVVSISGSDPIGSDVQGVMDVTDPYSVMPNPDPADQRIMEGSGGSVTYYPTVINRNSGTAISPQPKFNFYARNAVGVTKKTASNVAVDKTNKVGFTIDETDCSDVGGNISVVMTTNDF
jgi:hypothetical protein